jgi:SH3/ankyrin repeat-containing protein
MLQVLYNGGAHLDFRSKDGATALHKATVRGGFKSVEMMFQLGGAPDMRDNDGKRMLPVGLCKRLERLSIAAVSRQYSDLFGFPGLTALHQACVNGGGSNHVRSVQMLLKQGCEVGFRDHQGWTELHHVR